MMDWDKINAVQRMQEYILCHIEDEITLQALSDVSGYSLWHTIRIFKEFIGQTPFEYIRGVRLTKAAQELRDTNKNVLDVACRSSFDSHDGFTRAFSRQFGITPQKYRKNKPAVNYFTYYPVRDYYLYMSSQKRSDKIMEKQVLSKTVTVQAIFRSERKLIILRSKKATDYMSYCEEVGCDWEGVMNSVSEKMDEAAMIQLPRDMVKEGTSSSASGVEVPLDFSKTLPDGYEVVTLPPCTMLYFQGMPFENEEDFCEAIKIVEESIQNYKPELYGYRFADEIAPRFNFGASAKTGAKMAIPVKSIE